MKTIKSWGYSFKGSYKVENINKRIFKKGLSANQLRIARGNGRSYYDQSLLENGNIITLNGFNKILEFDEQSGVLTCQSGITLQELLKFSLPYGFMPACMPGSKKVTIGGMIASNVHGKNHHRKGGMLNIITKLNIFNGKDFISCSRQNHSDLFKASIGGMGLTGIICSAELKLQRVENTNIKVEKKISKGIKNILKDIDRFDNKEYVVTWVNLLEPNPTGISISGQFAEPDDSTKEIFLEKYSIYVPLIGFFSFFINNLLVRLFNNLYILISKNMGSNLVTLDTFFFPLDRVKNFNKIYGKNGLIQFHGVVPKDSFEEFFKELHESILCNKATPTLTIIKKLKKEDHFISFPIEGFSIAIDFKRTMSHQKLVQYLNEVCSKFGGRVYLTKDSLLDAELFKTMYPLKKNFEQIRTKYSLCQFRSLLSNRLKIK